MSVVSSRRLVRVSCEFFDLCDCESGVEGGVLRWHDPLFLHQSCETARNVAQSIPYAFTATFKRKKGGTWLVVVATCTKEANPPGMTIRGERRCSNL